MKKYIIVLIFLLALFLRTYKLGQYPVGFLWDEAALGYNAYSILNTAKDEYGKFLPIIFKSFGDYKPGFYVYLTIPSVLIFGLNEFAVRFPSALFGSLTVVFLYLFMKEFFNKETSPYNKFVFSNLLPLLSAFLLTISPWHINFSRGSWELNIMLFELVLGLFLLARYHKTQKKSLLIVSAFVFTFSLFTYQAAKLLMPVLVLGFFFFFREKLLKNDKKNYFLFLTILLGGFLLFNLMTIVGGMAGRIKVMSIFSYPRSPNETQVILDQDDDNKLDFSLFHSSPVFFTRAFLGRYFNYFSGKFLFVTGDWSNPRNGVTYQGVLYYADLIFLVFGLAILFRKKRESIENFFLFWLVVAPVPAALTRDSISSVRSFSMVIPFVFIVAVGINGTIFLISKMKTLVKRGIFALIALIYILCFLRFLELYFVHDPMYSSESRLYGYRQVISFIKPLVEGRDKIIFTSKYGQPYIFYLFYTKYDPKKYQAQSKLTESMNGDVGAVEKIDNIEFRKIYFPDDRSIKNSLFIGDEFDLSLSDIVGQEGISFLKQVNFFNNNTAFRIVETK